MASPAHGHPQPPPNPCGATAAPPPTPSSHPNHPSKSDDAAATDALSSLLHRLPSSLSLPSRLTTAAAHATCPTIASLSDQNSNWLEDILAASRLGFFQLAGHPVPRRLAESAESDALALLDLPRDEKRRRFPSSWPLGFDGGDESDEEDGDGRAVGSSLCLDSASELGLSSLREFAGALERVAMEVVELLSCAVGFENPIRGSGEGRVCGLMWISEGVTGAEVGAMGRVYPYVVGVQYQIRRQEYEVLADSGRVLVEPQVDSLMVTLGDIAQVWSNGRLKKVRGRPMAAGSSKGDGESSNSKAHCLLMSLLLTLPSDAIVSPLPPRISSSSDSIAERGKDEEEEQMMMYKSFPFEDYAWRVYHERLHFKDPLQRYRNF